MREMNWQIALVDDESSQLELLEKLINEYSKNNSIHPTILTFESAEAFLFYFEENQNIDLLILDIEMSGMNGMELAKKIRAAKHSLNILFVTGYVEYSLEGYKVNAIDYILKPIDQDKLTIALNKFRNILPEKEDYLFLETPEALLKINIYDIISLEALGHETVIRTTAETIEVNRGLGSLLEELPTQQFFKTHRSYLVNLEHVVKIVKTEVQMTDKSIVPVSRRAYKPLNQAFIQYFKKE